jgi:hypothetical protein
LPRRRCRNHALAASAFAGDEVCARCHPGQVRSFRNGGMGKLILPLPDVSKPVIVAGFGGVSYRVLQRDGAPYQELLRGDTALESHRILYGIGSEHGVSYGSPEAILPFLAPLSRYTKKDMGS